MVLVLALAWPRTRGAGQPSAPRGALGAAGAGGLRGPRPPQMVLVLVLVQPAQSQRFFFSGVMKVTSTSSSLPSRT
jgi:hypothetical protein